MKIQYCQHEIDDCFSRGMELHQVNIGYGDDIRCLFGFLIKDNALENTVCIWKIKYKAK